MDVDLVCHSCIWLVSPDSRPVVTIRSNGTEYGKIMEFQIKRSLGNLSVENWRQRKHTQKDREYSIADSFNWIYFFADTSARISRSSAMLAKKNFPAKVVGYGFMLNCDLIRIYHKHWCVLDTYWDRFSLICVSNWMRCTWNLTPEKERSLIALVLLMLMGHRSTVNIPEFSDATYFW